MIRLSVSDLESWRYLKANEDATLEDIVARLSHKEPPTPQMEAGRALAKLFEEVTPRSIDAWTSGDGWRFRFEIDGARFALPAVRELKGEMVFATPSGPVTLVGMVDGLDGLVVSDQKLTERFDAERYLDSLQWRAYLVMFWAREFRYDIFVGKYDDREVTITEYHPIRFYAYPNIRDDVQRAVNDLAAVIATYLPERVTPIAAPPPQVGDPPQRRS